jgi:energy-coupling factor transporter ATP-binding protein EcfA2
VAFRQGSRRTIEKPIAIAPWIKRCSPNFSKPIKISICFPWWRRQDIERFRVDYGLAMSSCASSKKLSASDKHDKFVFAGHRGCGKSTLLKRLSIEMQKEHFTVFFSIADLIEMSGITHTNILYTIALMLLHRASLQRMPIAEDIKETILGWNSTVRTQVARARLGKWAGGRFLDFVTAKLKQEKSFRDELETTFEKKISDLVGKCDRLAAAIQISDEAARPGHHRRFRQARPPFSGSKSTATTSSPVFTPVPHRVHHPGVGGARAANHGSLELRRDCAAPPVSSSKVLPEGTSATTPKRNQAAKTVDTFLGSTAKAPARWPGAAGHRPQDGAARVAASCESWCESRGNAAPKRWCNSKLSPIAPPKAIDDEILTAALRNLRNDFARQIGSDLYDAGDEVYDQAEPAGR